MPGEAGVDNRRFAKTSETRKGNRQVPLRDFQRSYPFLLDSPLRQGYELIWKVILLVTATGEISFRPLFRSFHIEIAGCRATRCLMKRAIARSGGLVAALLLLGLTASAHHGGSDYDVQHPVTLKGTVTEFYWSNPHCQIFVDVKDDNSKAVNWTIETLAPAVLKRAG